MSQGLTILNWVFVSLPKHIAHMSELQSQNHVLSRPPLNKSECLATEIISASKILTSDDNVHSISTSSVQISEKV